MFKVWIPVKWAKPWSVTQRHWLMHKYFTPARSAISESVTAWFSSSVPEFKIHDIAFGKHVRHSATAPSIAATRDECARSSQANVVTRLRRSRHTPRRCLASNVEKKGKDKIPLPIANTSTSWQIKKEKLQITAQNSFPWFSWTSIIPCCSQRRFLNALFYNCNHRFWELRNDHLTGHARRPKREAWRFPKNDLRLAQRHIVPNANGPSRKTRAKIQELRRLKPPAVMTPTETSVRYQQ
jgi:hypothetical protein